MIQARACLVLLTAIFAVLYRWLVLVGACLAQAADDFFGSKLAAAGTYRVIAQNAGSAAAGYGDVPHINAGLAPKFVGANAVIDDFSAAILAAA